VNMFGQISDVISENPDEFRRRKMLQPSVEEIQSQRPSEEDYYKHAGIARKILGAIAPPPYNEEILYGGFNRRMRDYNARLKGAVLAGDIQGAEQLRKAQISELGQRGIAEAARAGAESQRSKLYEHERTPEYMLERYGAQPRTMEERSNLERIMHPRQFTPIPHGTSGIMSSEGEISVLPPEMQGDNELDIYRRKL